MDAPIFRLENMVILTNIPPRRDGTVVVDVGGTIYTFSRRIENGPLCCDVDSLTKMHITCCRLLMDDSSSVRMQ